MIPGAGIMERRERNMVRHSNFSKPLQHRKPCLIFNSLFSPWYRVQESWKEEREIWSCIPFFQNLYSTENRASCLISFFPHDTVCRNHGKKREKYGQAFHFSKPPPPQVEEKISYKQIIEAEPKYEELWQALLRLIRTCRTVLSVIGQNLENLLF